MNSETRILLIEDDHLQAHGIQAGVRNLLQPEYPHLVFETLSTESDFYQRFDEIAEKGFDLAIVDVMLRWADPSAEMPEPRPEVVEGGFFRAGIRCKQKLQSDPRTALIPTIIYTVLDESRLPRGIDIVPKGADFAPLADKIRQLLPGTSEP
jgi:DNA-binding NarL/FixJ family response regulator